MNFLKKFGRPKSRKILNNVIKANKPRRRLRMAETTYRDTFRSVYYIQGIFIIDTNVDYIDKNHDSVMFEAWHTEDIVMEETWENPDFMTIDEREEEILTQLEEIVLTSSPLSTEEIRDEVMEDVYEENAEQRSHEVYTTEDTNQATVGLLGSNPEFSHEEYMAINTNQVTNNVAEETATRLPVREIIEENRFENTGDTANNFTEAVPGISIPQTAEEITNQNLDNLTEEITEFSIQGTTEENRLENTNDITDSLTRAITGISIHETVEESATESISQITDNLEGINIGLSIEGNTTESIRQISDNLEGSNTGLPIEENTDDNTDDLIRAINRVSIRNNWRDEMSDPPTIDSIEYFANLNADLDRRFRGVLEAPAEPSFSDFRLYSSEEEE